MSNLIEKTGVMGGDLPNIYIDKIQINNNKITLSVSRYEEKKQDKHRRNENDIIYHKIIQISNLKKYTELIQTKNIEIIKNLTEDTDIKIIDFNFSESEQVDLPRLFRSYRDVLIKKSKNIIFDFKKKNKFLYYIAISYFYDENMDILIQSNSSMFSKKTIEEVMIEGEINKSQKDFYFQNSEIPWFGDVIQRKNSYFTFESSQQKLDMIISENQKITILSDSDKSEPPKTYESPLSIKTAEKVYQEFLSQSPIFNPEQMFTTYNSDDTVGINFSINYDKLIIENFLNKSFIGNDSEMLKFLKNCISEREVKLLKKFIPNKNIFLSDVNINQEEIICSTKYTKSLKSENEYLFSMNDQQKNADKYDYFVELIFENNTNELILQQIKNLNNSRNTLQIYYESFKRSGNLYIDDLKKYYDDYIVSIIAQYRDLYSIIFNIKDNKEEIYFKSSNLLKPGIANYFEVQIFIQMFDNLIKEYNNLYESINPSRILNSFDSSNAKITNFTYRQKIKQNELNIFKKNMRIIYINKLNNSTINIQDFVDRIKQEKARFFNNQTINIVGYSQDNMFSYLSPDSIFIKSINGEDQYKLSDLEEESAEITLNNLVIQGKLSEEIRDINLNSPIKQKENFDNENLKNLLSENSVSYFSKKYGLSIESYRNDLFITNKISDLAKLMEFNNIFNINIPSNISNLPNHLVKVREQGINLTSYSSIFDYRILMEIHCYLNDTWTLMTKNVLLDIVNKTTYSTLNCKIVPHKYEYNQNLKYDIQEFCTLQQPEFKLLIDRNIPIDLIKQLINSV